MKYKIKQFEGFYTPSTMATKAYVDSMFDSMFNKVLMVDENFNTRLVDIDIEKEKLLTRRKNIIKGI